MVVEGLEVVKSVRGRWRVLGSGIKSRIPLFLTYDIQNICMQVKPLNEK